MYMVTVSSSGIMGMLTVNIHLYDYIVDIAAPISNFVEH